MVLSRPLLWIPFLCWCFLLKLNALVKSLSLQSEQEEHHNDKISHVKVSQATKLSTQREPWQAKNRETKKITYISDEYRDRRYRDFPFISNCIFLWFPALFSLLTKQAYRLSPGRVSKSSAPAQPCCTRPTHAPAPAHLLAKPSPATGNRSTASCWKQERLQGAMKTNNQMKTV